MRHSFSVEMSSKVYLHQLYIPDHGEVLLEGELGEIIEVGFVEGRVLVVSGSHGVLRLDVCEELFRSLLSPEKWLNDSS